VEAVFPDIGIALLRGIFLVQLVFTCRGTGHGESGRKREGSRKRVDWVQGTKSQKGQEEFSSPWGSLEKHKRSRLRSW
jgi:hypothetical protein